MTPRERYVTAITFGRPDRVPLDPGWPRESTLRVWTEQGLPAGSNWRECLLEHLGLQAEPSSPRTPLDVSFGMIPTFEERVLARRDGHLIVQDWMGAITEISDVFDASYIRSAKDFVTRKWHRFPVESRSDWMEKIVWRYDSEDPLRYPDDFLVRCDALMSRDYVVGLTVNGPFWQLREWCGLENLCIMMVEQPDFVQEMIEFWAAFVTAVLGRVLAHVSLDYVQISEDMAFKLHSMISPKMARQSLLPVWLEWTSLIRRSGCPIVTMDSDGYVAELLPIWIEAGINCSVPMEVAAGNDIVAARCTYGRDMAYLGGIDKRAIAAGGDHMRDEVMRVVPPLLRDGGYIPGCDHGVPPDISWPDFVGYSRLLAQLTGWL
ncbi:MAG: hypothetical protein GX620_02505 [Chloroflexi bacterium]|nr:hypothetical protein [Chloroflexota bacterium]